MELDGYCRPLGLAFEHHGEHHYSTKSLFARSDKLLQQRQENDELKRRLCSIRGIVLIDVPEIPTRLPIVEIRAYIRRECERNGISLPDDLNTKEFDLKNAYTVSGSMEALKELELIAKFRGGKCLSCNYVNARTNLLWECAAGHQWKATPDNIKGGRWCPTCSRKKGVEARRLTFEQMQQIAEARSGKCLSNTYVNNHTKLSWECSKGHKWEATPMSIRRGSWCPYCSGNVKHKIEDMRLFAESMGGKCLSTIYINAHENLEWKCALGHQWKAPFNKTKYRWCPECIRMRRKSS